MDFLKVAKRNRLTLVLAIVAALATMLISEASYWRSVERLNSIGEMAAARLTIQPFDAPDDKPVSLVFALLVPEQATEKHLQILSELAQMFSDRALRESMAAAANAAGLHQLVATWHPDAAGQRHAVA